MKDPDDDFSLWNTSISDYCSWRGVKCDAKSGEVISLVLDFILLNRPLKSNSSLFKLQHLSHLSLSACDLRGEIISSLGNLPHLTYLDLSNNHLVGEIPSSLGNLSHLTYLDLSNNHLIGEVPSSIGSLNQLTFLSFSSNNLSGNIPISFANFNKLSNLLLYQNKFSYIDFPLSLSDLDLSYNKLEGQVPSFLWRLYSLKLSHNSFTNLEKSDQVVFDESHIATHFDLIGTQPLAEFIRT
ncbi:unnamed protein product [Thlaspi arvense]|uniref:Leucine-rich repeat-containing N-terminal plant-type domain-containing protein n=1 Tax=Thlaspi arvense TaxID=13288 RepID=A0AAU9SIK5_THLAR|nr:unnamed protein product [Thlaspi arvense]